MESRANQLGITVQGGYVTPSEHRFYFIIEADHSAAISTFLGPALLTDHAAHTAPVLSLEQAAKAVSGDYDEAA